MRQFSLSLRKIQDHVSIAVAHRSLLELVEFRRSLSVEISARHRRVLISFAGDKLANVSAIFAEQGLTVIFRMALKVNGKTLSLSDEHVGANLTRFRHDAIVSCDERFLGQ